MQVSAIKAALKASDEFGDLARKLLKHTIAVTGVHHHEYIETGKLSGAVRRQSMNLTRALAEMRKP